MSSMRFVRGFSTRANVAKFVVNSARPKAVLGTHALRPLVIPNLKRAYSTQEEKTESGRSSNLLLWLGAAGLIGAGAGYYFYSYDNVLGKATKKPETKTVDYQKVYNQIADILEDNDWDDGSYGPVFVRLAWHAAGTYDKVSKTGGSNGATMRFSPESDHGANVGLNHAREKLEPIKKQNPDISYSDLWSLAGVCAIQEMV
jgi:cytochrome c peroxidase